MGLPKKMLLKRFNHNSHNNRSLIPVLSCLLWLMNLLTVADAQSLLSLCSHQNTGLESTLNVSTYQSNGLCEGTCAGYAYGIVQFTSCWCSNVMPGSSVDLSQCDSQCPGYPLDLCGNQDEGLFGYLLLSTPTSTAAADSSDSSESINSSTSAPPTTTTNSVFSTPTKLSTTFSTIYSLSQNIFTNLASSLFESLPASLFVSDSPSRSSIVVLSSSSLISLVKSLTLDTNTLPTSSSLPSSFASQNSISSTLASTPVIPTTHSTLTSSVADSSDPSSSSTSSAITDSKSVSTSSSASTSFQSPSLIISVVTITGAPQTLTVTKGGGSSFSQPTTAPDSSSTSSADPAAISVSPSDNSKSSGSSFWSDKGKVAGVFTAVGVIALALIGLLCFCLFRRHRKNDEDSDFPKEVNGGSKPTYRDSKLGTFNILNGGSGAANGGIQREKSTSTTLAGLAFDEKATMVPITVDQRLDPGAMYMRWDHNDSRRSLQDEHDYSRKVLRVTNPDHSH